MPHFWQSAWLASAVQPLLFQNFTQNLAELFVSAAGSVTFVLGAIMANSVTRFPARTAILETCAGLLLIGGLILLGYEMRFIAS